jgi:hypothetical protein
MESRYIKAPGNTRQYINTATGETISYRKYLNEKRGVTPEEYARSRGHKQSRHDQLAKEYKDVEAKRQTKELRKIDPHAKEVKSKDIRTRGKSAEAEKFKRIKKGLKKKNNDAKGDKAKALEDLDRRPEGAVYPVGDTPK